MEKYELTDETMQHDGVTLHRIKALHDIPRHNVKAGDLGGYIQSEDNLSQTGDCWVGGNARVYGDALVFGRAKVWGDAKVYGDAWVFGRARVYGKALVFGYARVGGNTYLDSGFHTTEQNDNNKRTKSEDTPTSLTHGIVKQTNEGWQNLPDDKAYPILMTTHDNRETAIVKERFRLQWVYECGHKEPINEDDKWYSLKNANQVYFGS